MAKCLQYTSRVHTLPADALAPKVASASAVTVLAV